LRNSPLKFARGRHGTALEAVTVHDVELVAFKLISPDALRTVAGKLF
jgi:hypothetical protein